MPHSGSQMPMVPVRVENPQMPMTTTTRYLAAAFSTKTHTGLAIASFES
jgi:hypothetical protein